MDYLCFIVLRFAFNINKWLSLFRLANGIFVVETHAEGSLVKITDAGEDIFRENAFRYFAEDACWAHWSIILRFRLRYNCGQPLTSSLFNLEEVLQSFLVFMVLLPENNLLNIVLKFIHVFSLLLTVSYLNDLPRRRPLHFR